MLMGAGQFGGCEGVGICKKIKENIPGKGREGPESCVTAVQWVNRGTWANDEPRSQIAQDYKGILRI